MDTTVGHVGLCQKSGSDTSTYPKRRHLVCQCQRQLHIGQTDDTVDLRHSRPFLHHPHLDKHTPRALGILCQREGGTHAGMDAKLVVAACIVAVNLVEGDTCCYRIVEPRLMVTASVLRHRRHDKGKENEDDGNAFHDDCFRRLIMEVEENPSTKGNVNTSPPRALTMSYPTI